VSGRTGRAVGAAIAWQVVLIRAGSLHEAHQAAPGVRCAVRRRGSPTARFAARLTPRLKVTRRAGAGFVLIEASGRAGRSVRAAVGPRLRVQALRTPGTTSTGSGLSVQIEPESVVDRGCGGRKRRVRRDSGPHPQGDPSGCPESRIT
jgi:predicted lipoprotein